jgi:hypothetical protein
VAYLLARAYHTLLTAAALVNEISGGGVDVAIAGKSLDELRVARNRNAAEVRALASILQATNGADGKRAAVAAAAAVRAAAAAAAAGGGADDSDRMMNDSERRSSGGTVLDAAGAAAEAGPPHVRGVCGFLMDMSHADDSSMLDGESWISAASNEMSMMGGA